MTERSRLEALLGIEELRAGLLRYTRRAFGLLPSPPPSRILDIGCGSGLPTVELARLAGGMVIGIDTDSAAIERLVARSRDAGLADRIRTVHGSILEADLADGSFDLLWEEGVLHILDPDESLPRCHRLLKPGGWLVMNETLTWLRTIRERLREVGFEPARELLLPPGNWWPEYYAPLEDRIRRLRAERGDEVDAEALAAFDREVAAVKADPRRFDCGFFLARKPEIGRRPAG